MVNNSREAWKTRGNVFDGYTERLLFKLGSQGHFEELESPVALGKEANVFTARKKDGSMVIIKIYRLESCNFNKMFDYIKTDPRYLGMPKSRRKVIFSWVQREYRNLLKARESIRVPTPIVNKDHVLVMEPIGGEDSIAPLLKDAIPKDPDAFFTKVIDDVMKLWKEVKLVHGDLSEFNILNNNEEPVIIDFSQATVTDAYNAKELLARDLEILCKFFAKHGVQKDPKELFTVITQQK